MFSFRRGALGLEAMLLRPSVNGFILKAVLTDTLLEAMLVVLLVGPYTSGASTSSLGPTGQINAAMWGTRRAGPYPMLHVLLFDGYFSSTRILEDRLWINTQGSLSNQISTAAFLHRRSAGVQLALPRGRQVPIVEGLAAHFG